MALIEEVRLTWTGWPGGPGVSTYYGSDASTLRAALGDFMAATDQMVPGQITQTIPAEGRILNDTNGVLTGYWSDGVPIVDANVVSLSFAAPAGLCINWLTGAVHNGHVVRGRTFLVPLVTQCFDGDGTIEPQVLADARAAANALAASGTMRIWSRPTATVEGASFPVTSAQVNDRVAILTSRRA